MPHAAPPVSIVLPVYNAADTLDEAMGSICHQSFPDFELLVIDDGSRDASPDIIQKRARTDQRVRPIRTRHKGIVHALNTGLDSARGTYIARMDADDVSLPKRIEKQHAFLDAHPRTGLVACLVEHKGNEGKTAGYRHYVQWINTLTTFEQISLCRFIESPLAHPSVMFQKKLVSQYGGYRKGCFPEDYELWLRWLEQGVRIEKIPEVLLGWRDTPGRLSRTESRYSTDAFYHLKARYLSRWLERHNPHHPDVIVWGAGRTSRRRAEYLVPHGIRISAYVDVDPKKIGNTVQDRPVVGLQDIPPAGLSFIVSFVGLRDINNKIYNFLSARNYTQGKDYIFAA